jgi:glucose dehydrogenase
MYLSTPHESVLALDAATGKLKWQFPSTRRLVRVFSARCLTESRASHKIELNDFVLRGAKQTDCART